MPRTHAINEKRNANTGQRTAPRLQFERGTIRKRANRSSRVMRAITERDYNGAPEGD